MTASIQVTSVMGFGVIIQTQTLYEKVYTLVKLCPYLKAPMLLCRCRIKSSAVFLFSIQLWMSPKPSSLSVGLPRMPPGDH